MIKAKPRISKPMKLANIGRKCSHTPAHMLKGDPPNQITLARPNIPKSDEVAPLIYTEAHEEASADIAANLSPAKDEESPDEAANKQSTKLMTVTESSEIDAKNTIPAKVSTSIADNGKKTAVKRLSACADLDSGPTGKPTRRTTLLNPISGVVVEEQSVPASALRRYSLPAKLSASQYRGIGLPGLAPVTDLHEKEGEGMGKNDEGSEEVV